MKQKNIVFLLLVGCILLSFLVSESSANIIIKVRALNPLESEEVAAIRYPLPQEITPGDIVKKNIVFSLPAKEEGEPRKDTFNVEYVQEEGKYFIIDEVMMGPREVITLEAHVRDIWSISEERFSGIKKDVESLVAEFTAAPSEEEEDSEAVEEASDETALLLQDEIFSQLDAIADRQVNSSVVKVGVEGHMEAYYENMEALSQVEADVLMLRSLLEPEEEEIDLSLEEDGAPEPESSLSE